MLEVLFISVLKMSITASVAAAVVIIFRWMLGNRLPKALSYALWAIVLFRLLIPFSMPSVFSIFNAVSVPEGLAPQSSIYNELYKGLSDTADVGSITEESLSRKILEAVAVRSIPMGRPEASADPLQIVFFAAAWIWLLGAIGLFLFSIYAYNKTAYRLNEAVIYKNKDLIKHLLLALNIKQQIQIFTSKLIPTPVVCGLLKPRIILPEDLVQSSSEQEISLIITHELIHIKRLDYIMKPFAVMVLCLHWFNPVVWLSFILFQKDMEMSCDARVLSANSNDIRSVYAKSLINAAARQNVLLNGGLLAFGERNIKSRVKGIMEYKKTRMGLAAIAIVIIAALGILLLTNGLNTDINKALISNDKLDNLLQHRSKYIGDASNVGNLLSKLPYGKNLDGISLQTKNTPYELTINYKLEEALEEKNVKPVLLDNALLLFGLIENLDIVNFNISTPSQLQIQFSRTEMQRYFDMDIWSYSMDKRSFEEFLLNISFDVLTFPEIYTPAMSSVPGIRIDISLNAEYYNLNYGRSYSVKNGFLRTWTSGKLSDPAKEISPDNIPVYWSPENMTDDGTVDNVTISILDENGNVIIDKKLDIVKEEGFYRVESAPYILTYDYYSGN